MAAKALRERLEAEKVMEKMRKRRKLWPKRRKTFKSRACANLRAANDALVAEENSSAERYAFLKTKYNKVKGLRESIAERDAQIDSLKAKLSDQGRIWSAATSNPIFTQTLREMIDIVEGLQEEVREIGEALSKYKNYMKELVTRPGESTVAPMETGFCV
ncbi:hypothetical protein B0H14DRAFT_3673360 [Mycena olivaceomarginata]|nr:hypothetical protein B0H14DRAFT_3673360 [Mycena olivaceomarginata]